MVEKEVSMTLVELDARLKEMKNAADTSTTIHFNNYMIVYEIESGGFYIMTEMKDDWDNYKIIEWVATVKHIIDVIKIVQ